ncbi:MAG: sigma-54 interaction domain-containing protein [Desulfitobacterium sp.]
MDNLQNVYEQLKLVQELNSELEAIIDSSHDGIGVVDTNGNLVRLNKNYERITGLKTSDILNKPLQNLVDLGIFSAAPSLVALREERQVTMTQIIYKTGIKVLITSTPVFNSDGEIIRVVANIRDLTALELLREENLKNRTLNQSYRSELEVLKAQDLLPQNVVARSEKMLRVVEMAVKVAHTDTNVLIEGESGVGKEVIAKLIHSSSNRKDESYIKINCAAIPENLLESELFGYAPGAFTGAQKGGKMGMLELAQNGTILMDEIGELSLALQAKLLRALEDQTIYRVGATKPIKLNIRVIAATNRNLHEMVDRKEFRRDLYYRLRVFPITVPPLCQRLEDIPPLVNFYLSRMNSKLQTKKSISIPALKFLETYKWPGNVRQLQNVLEGVVIFSDSNVISVEDIKSFLDNQQESDQPHINDLDCSLPEAQTNLEKRLLVNILKQSNSARQAARLLGVSHPTVLRKMKMYGLTIGKEINKLS